MTTPAPRNPEENEHSGSDPLPAEADRGRRDGLLDSIGKAISSPIVGAAEEDEPSGDSKKPPTPPG